MAEATKRPGAAGTFQSLRTKTSGSVLAEWVTGKVSLLLILAVLVTMWLPHKVTIDVNSVLWALGIYFVYMLFLEVASRRFRAHYDKTWFKMVRIQANIAVVSVLIWCSSGVHAYFWFFFSLPIFATIIYFDRLSFALLTYGEILLLYVMVSLGAPGTALDSFDVGLFTMNSSILLLLLFVLFHLFRFAKDRARLEHLHVVQQVAADINTTIDLEDLFEAILDKAIEVVGAKSGSLMLFDTQAKALKVHALHGIGKIEDKEHRTFRVGEGIAGWVAEHQKPYLCSDVTKDSLYVVPVDRQGIRSLLSVPIVSHEHLVGVINIDSLKVNFFNEDDTQLLLTLASQVASAVERAKLLQALRELKEFGEMAADEKAFLDRVAGSICELLHTPVCVIRLLDPDDGQFKITTVIGAHDLYPRDLALSLANPATKEFVERYLQKGGPLYISDVTDPQKAPKYLYREVARELDWKSMLTALLVVEGEVIGMIDVNTHEVHEFTSWEKNVFVVFANEAAEVLEHFRLDREVKQRAQELDALRQTALNITAQLDRDKLLQAIIQRAVELLGAKGGGIYEYNPGQGELKVVTDWGGKRSIAGNTLKVGEGMAGRVVETGEPLIVEDYGTWPHRAPVFEPDLFRAVIEVPLRWEDRILGVLYVTDNAEGRVFTQHDAELLELLASQAAIAIGNAELFERTQRNLAQLTVLHQINAHMGAALTLEDVLQVTLSEGLRAIGTNEGSVMLFNPTTNELEIRAWIVQGEFASGKRHRTLALGEGIAGHVATTGEAYNCPDVSTDPHFVESFTGRSLRSLVCVPIVSHGRVLGTVNADSGEPRFFTADDGQFLSALAGHLAIAIESHWLKEIGLILSSLSLDKVLAKVVESASLLTGSEFSTMFLVDDKTAELVRAANFPLSRKTTAGPRKNGLSYLVMSSGKPIVVPDAQRDPRVKQESKDQGIKSIVGVPLDVRVEHNGLAEVKTIGVLFVNTTRQLEFGDRDVGLLHSLANQAAIAIENARLFEQTHRRALALEALHQTSLDITSYQRVPDLVKSILERAAELLQAEGGGLYLLDESGKRVKLVAVSNLPDDFEGSTLEVGDSVVGQVIRKGAPLSIADYQNWPHRLRQYDEYGFTAVVGAPIAWQDKIWGAIAVHTDVEGRIFTQEDLGLLSHLGNLAAVALENARRMDESERLMRSAIDAVIAVDEEGKVVKFNEQAERILGYKAEEVLGQPVKPLYYCPEEAPRVKQRLLESKDGRITDYDTFVRSKDGEKIPIRLSASLLFDYEGKRAGSVGFFRDLREIESARRQIRQLTGLLEVGQAITELRDLQAVLDVIADETMRALNADVVSLYSYDAQQDEIHVPPVRRGLRHEEAASLDVGADSVVRKVIRHGEAHFANDALTDPLVSGDFVNREGVRSCAACPLKVRDETVGVLFCSYRESHPFSDGEQAVISLFANEAAIAIENAQLYGGTRQQAERFQTLYQASLSLTAELSLNAVLQSVVGLSRELAGAKYGALGVLDEAGEFEHFITSGLSEEELVHIDSLACRKGLLEVVLCKGKPLRIADISKDPRAAGFPLHHPHMQNLLGVPLFAKGKLIGGLWLTDKREAPEFTEEDEALLGMLATEIAITIENARLYEETTQRLAESQALQQVGVSLTETLELHTVLERVMREAIRLTDADEASILFYDTGQGEFADEALTISGLDESLRQYQTQVRQREGIAYTIIQQGQPLAIPDTLQDSRVSPVAIEKGRRATVGVPLRGRQGAIGVLFVNWRAPHRLREREEDLLTALASQAAVAIENARLYEETHRKLEELGLLHKVATVAASSIELDQVLESIVNTLAETLGYESVGIRLVDEGTRRLKVRPHYAGPLARPLENIEIELGSGITGWVAEHGEALLVPDVSQDKRYIPGNPLTKSEMCAPFRVGDKVIGVIDVQSATINAYSDHDLQILETIAGQVAKIVENARLYEEEEHRARQMAAIAEIGRTINASLDLNTTLNAILASIKPLIDYTAAEICLWDEEKQAMAVCGQAGDPRYTERAGGIYGLDEGYSGWIACHQQPLLIKDALERNDVQPKVTDPDRPIHSFVGVPLQTGDGRFGTLELVSDSPQAFDEDDEQLLAVIGEHAITAITNARLFEAEQRRAEQLRVLNELSRQTTSILRLDCLLNQAARLIGEALSYTIGIGLVEGDQVVFKGAATYGFDGDVPEVNIVPVGEGITGWVAVSGESWPVPDVSKEPRYIPGRPTTRAELAVPLKVQDRTIGVLNVESTQTNAFDQNDRELLQAVAAQLAIAFENARQYEALEKAKETIAARTAVAWMGMVSSTWAHKIRGYAQTIKNYIDLLRPVLTESATGREVLERLDRIYVEAAKIQEIPLTAPLSSEEGIENIDLNALLRERVGRLLEPYKGSIALEVKLDLANSTNVRANRLWLMRVFDILVDNAIDALSGSEVRTLTISTDARGDSVKVHIVDSGSGVPSAVRPLLFKEPVPKSEGETGSGMGLLLASTIIQTYGGGIALGPTGLGGTTIIVSLPKSH